jgi:hypothetical protein
LYSCEIWYAYLALWDEYRLRDNMVLGKVPGPRMQEVKQGGKNKGLWWKNLEESDCFEDTDIDGRIILQCILEKEDIRDWTRLIRRTVTDSCEHGNKLRVS